MFKLFSCNWIGVFVVVLEIIMLVWFFRLLVNVKLLWLSLGNNVWLRVSLIFCGFFEKLFIISISCWFSLCVKVIICFELVNLIVCMLLLIIVGSVFNDINLV